MKIEQQCLDPMAEPCMHIVASNLMHLMCKTARYSRTGITLLRKRAASDLRVLFQRWCQTLEIRLSEGKGHACLAWLGGRYCIILQNADMLYT